MHPENGALRQDRALSYQPPFAALYVACAEMRVRMSPTVADSLAETRARRRLGIAMALLSEPEFLILDEPTNGLDPQGINDVRTLIQRLNRDHDITFLISSHLLNEVEITCNRVGIIRNGKLVVQDKVKTLLQRSVHSVKIECDRHPEALEFLKKVGYVESAEEKGGTIRAMLDPKQFARLNAELVKAGFEVSGFTPVRLTLEEFFLTH